VRRLSTLSRITLEKLPRRSVPYGWYKSLGCYGSPPEIGVLVAKQKHDSGRKKMDQRRSKEKREPGGRRGDRAALGKGGSRGKR
jgi:hypothetical protein